jgi:Reverse transcriptase (RNA-dependent DNA polymerase)
MAWMTFNRPAELASFLDVPLHVLQAARRQIAHVYVQKTRTLKGKVRDLCYPRLDCELRIVQGEIKTRCLEPLPLSSAVRGYRHGQHNVNCAEVVSGRKYVAKLDIKSFHPSIRPGIVRMALRRFGVSHPMCRIITQLVTFNNSVPQGGLTSNHIANLVVDMVLADGILAFCAAHEVSIVNYGDDTAFGGNEQRAVDECVDYARGRFAKYDFETNSKSTSAEHQGAQRRFIGTATGREKPDLPRKKFREYRTEFRAALEAERNSPRETIATESAMNSLLSKKGYVARLSHKKARHLAELFYRLAHCRRGKQ